MIDLDADPFEQHNLSTRFPEKVKSLENEWNRWAETHLVLPLEDKPWHERIDFYKNLNDDQSGREE